MGQNPPNTFALTFDTDWVPQFVMDHVIDFLAAYDLPATFFCTSPYKLPRNEQIETALHPNFLENSTQGEDEESRLQYLKDLYPEAIGSRSHRFYWHSGIKTLLQSKGILYDASLPCPLQTHLGRIDSFGIIRFPTWWTDGFQLLSKRRMDVFDLPGMRTPGLKVMMFHPIHIYCNTNSHTDFKAAMRGFDLPNATPGDLEGLRNPGQGISTFFEAVLSHLKARKNTCTLKNLCTD